MTAPSIPATQSEPPQDRATTISTGRRLRILGIAVLYLPLWALLCNFVLEMSIWWGMGAGERPQGSAPSGPAWYEVFVRGYGYWLGSLVVWIVLVTLVALTNRMWLSMGVLMATTLVVAAVNRVKLSIRSEPFYPSDLDFLTQPRFLMEMVSPGWLLALCATVLVVILATVRVGRRMDRIFPRVRRTDSPGWWWSLLGTRVICAALGLLLLGSMVHFNDPGNPWRKVYEAKGAEWRFWYQRLNYRDNGFIGGLLYNMPTSAMQRPAGYSRATMESIASKYSTLADEVNADRTPGAIDDVNVVVILSEAFSDPAELEGFELDEDPIRQTRALMDQVTSGTMLAQLYGGGTANVEFEALTGHSLALFEPQMNTPYQMMVPEHDNYPSAVDWFTDNGHRPIAIHPYFTGMYKRDRVYDVLGFERFVHDTTMQSDERLDDTEFISDRAAFHEVVHQIEQSDDPLFVNLVTMQNHVPARGWDDPIGVSGVENSEQRDRIGQYARGLAETDAALRSLFDELERSEERTVVVLFGDHQPGIYDEELTRQQDDDLAMYRTPFFIWDSEGRVPRQSLPTTSPIHFLPLLFDAVDQPTTPFYALLDKVRERIPAMEQGRMLTPTGEPRGLDDLEPEERALIDELRLVQYDLSVGERYIADTMWSVP